VKYIERFSGIFLIAGLFLLIGAMLSLGIVPAMMVDRLHPEQGLPHVVPANMTLRYASVEAYRVGLMRGRDIYVAEGCWHCHSQYVRPVGNENLMYGPVSTAGEFQTVLQRPQLLGTRRVGPDLSRTAGKRSNDWHFAHLYEPRSVEPDSVMPSYTWLFDVKESKVPEPNEDGWALVAYLQQLGQAFHDERGEMPPEK
jgi:cbb3-type cytochrome c oxidase subunit II